MNSINNFVMYNPIVTGFVSLLERIDDRRPNLLRVLTYHHIVDTCDNEVIYPSMSIPVADFEQQMGIINARYSPITLSEVLKAHQNGDQLPPNSVLVTFDDAYIDFEENAWPVLKHFNIPCAVFVATSYPDNPAKTFWWDRLYSAFIGTQRNDVFIPGIGKLSLTALAQRKHAFSLAQEYVKSLQNHDGMAFVDEIVNELDVPALISSVLGWKDLNRLAQEGVELGAHSQTHPLFNRITIQEVHSEVRGSLNDLKREIGAVLPVFAYPSGNVNDEVVRALKAEGILLGFTTQRGINDFSRVNNLRLRRINVGRRTSPTILRAELLSWSRYCTNWSGG